VRELTYIVVEDHRFQREMLSRMLESLGARVVHQASNGRAALRMIEKLHAPPDIILTDLDMPTMDGMELIRHVAATWQDIALIITSARDKRLIASVHAMCDAYGVQLLGSVEKPVTPQKLEEMLSTHNGKAPRRIESAVAAKLTYSADEILSALDNGEIEPVFQPKVEIGTMRVAGAEALARWRHPLHGVVSPSAFIPVLESAGQGDALLFCMLGAVSDFCQSHLPGGRGGTIAVNVSLQSLSKSGAAERITTVVRARGIEPECLVLEITESGAATDIGGVLENLVRLRMRGFGLSIDDYGTGYSSMQQLSRVPFTELKIDQSFVRDAATIDTAKVILESSLDMARKLKLVAVAEGVETSANWHVLAALGCDVAQGYYIAKPMSGEAYLNWLKAWPLLNERHEQTIDR
jgi:EAL domain-containing protein (putative c-di-GMP-specific phosphodiesterase class I)/AmiR/NasT family two-component response regulator